MGYLKSTFLSWKRHKHPDSRFTGEQIEYLHLYFQNVESGSAFQLPDIIGVTRVQELIAEFWEDVEEGFQELKDY